MTMKTEQKGRQVALVLDPDFGSKLIDLAKAMPVWIVASHQNDPVIASVHAAIQMPAGTITAFPMRVGESCAATCERIVESLDQHHDEHSQTPGYTDLAVIGLSLGDVSLKPFLELGFSEFAQTANGFIARKTGVTQ